MPRIKQLNDAIKDKNLEEVKRILATNDEHGLINLKLGRGDSDNLTPLEAAIDAKSPEMLRYLLEQGAPINKSNERTGLFPIHVLAGNEFTETQENIALKMMAIFKEYKADFDEREKNLTRRNAMHIAIAYENFFLLDALHKNDSSVNAKDSRGDTPLYYAMEKLKDQNHSVVDQIRAWGGELPESRTNHVFSRPKWEDRRVTALKEYFGEIQNRHHNTNPGDYSIIDHFVAEQQGSHGSQALQTFQTSDGEDQHREKRKKLDESVNEAQNGDKNIQASSNVPAQTKSDQASKVVINSFVKVLCAGNKILFNLYLNKLKKENTPEQQAEIIQAVMQDDKIKNLESDKNKVFYEQGLSELAALLNDKSHSEISPSMTPG